MSLGWLPCLLFLLAATRQDVRDRGVSRLTLLVWAAVALAGAVSGAWSVSLAGGAMAYLILWVAGAPSGDKLGSVLVGAYLGLAVGYALVVALGLAFAWWRGWGSRRSPADFAFYPFLLAGTSVIMLATVLARGI